MHNQIQLRRYGSDDLQFDSAVVKPYPQQGWVAAGGRDLNRLDSRHHVARMPAPDAVPPTTRQRPSNLHRSIVGPITAMSVEDETDDESAWKV